MSLIFAFLSSVFFLSLLFKIFSHALSHHPLSSERKASKTRKRKFSTLMLASLYAPNSSINRKCHFIWRSLDEQVQTNERKTTTTKKCVRMKNIIFILIKLLIKNQSEGKKKKKKTEKKFPRKKLMKLSVNFFTLSVIYSEFCFRHSFTELHESKLTIPTQILLQVL